MRTFLRLVLLGPVVAGAIVAAALAVILAAPAGAGAQGSPERIVSYDTAFTIQSDGSVLVNEQIVYDFGSDMRHGIIREIPVRSRYNGSYDRLYPLTVRSVQSPDAPAQYKVENNGSVASIRIGDPGVLITGMHTYRLTYVLRGALNAFASHDELYWNATGNQWGVPIGQATVRVSAPVAVTRAVCFAGPRGSTSSCQQGGITDGVAHFTQAGLGPHEGVTVAVAIPAGVVVPARPVLQERWSFQRAFAATPDMLGVSGGLLLILVIAGAVIVLVKHRDRRPPVPAAGLPWETAGGSDQPAIEAGPPEGLRPAQAGVLLTGLAGSREITGTIVDLAVRGYLRIEDVPGAAASRDLQLVRLGEPSGQGGYLLDYERILLDGLFEDAAQESTDAVAEPRDAGADSGTVSVRLSSLSMGWSLRQVRNALYADAAGLGWFTGRPDRVRRRWRVAGWLVFVISVLLLLLVAIGGDGGLLPIPLVLAGLAMIVGARWMPVRTAKGKYLAARLRRFRDHIRAAAVSQAHPAGHDDVLFGYLPYAIVFRCTDDWATVTAALTEADQTPSWYRSSRPLGVGDMALLARSAYFFTYHHAAAHSVTTWSPTSASGGSGFSGGFSGGGGGGGGGGSW